MSALTHRPGENGLFDSAALCGATTADTGTLRMHEWDYNCPACKRLSGENVGGPVNDGTGDLSFPPDGADDAPDESKGAVTDAAPAGPPVCDHGRGCHVIPCTKCGKTYHAISRSGEPFVCLSCDDWWAA